MSDDEKPVPEPGEVEREDDEVLYHRVDETNVSDADQPKPEPPEDED
jgi:hypothetical protein